MDDPGEVGEKEGTLVMLPSSSFLANRMPSWVVVANGHIYCYGERGGEIMVDIAV